MATTRRAFMESMGMAGVGAVLAGSAETARGFARNGTLSVACIGTGGRCRTLMASLAKVPNVRMVAVCDVWDSALEQGKKLADPAAFVTKSYREILDRKDVDAVLIGTPDHWHVPIAVAACDAGKDVYVEKPLTHDPAEGPIIIAAQDRTGRVVQVGQQQRSMPHIQAARDWIKAGRIGRVFKVAASWNRNTGSRFQRSPLGINPASVAWDDFLGSAPKQPFDEYKFRNWRWFWDFGGGILTDLMVHWIDVAHWILELDAPLKAAAFGEHLAAPEVWETPDAIQCLLSYAGGVDVHFEGTFSNARHAARIEFMGPDGTIYVDRGAAILTPEGSKTAAESIILGTNPKRGADFYDKPDGELLHLTDWVEAIRARRKPSCPAEAGVVAAMSAHLGNRAFRSGQVAVRPA
ncbi:Gfo/Idh/MocA family protein [Tundrisphaera sp. TA3]|uniref:Gfo/Idh/MocA family protein n=1 Tax=Tundrisphaera sp. TA3 TaxID=3435775 RepID=UPI003EBB3B7E